MILDYAGNEKVPPDAKGIIEIGIRGAQFERLRGSTSVVLIDPTNKKSLRDYFKSFKPSRTMRWLHKEGYEFDVHWCPLESDELVKNAYQYRLNSHMAEHWEQPSGHTIKGGTDPTATRKGLRELGPIMASSNGDVWSDWFRYFDKDKFNSEFKTGPIHPQPPGSWSDWYPLSLGGIGRQLPKNRYGIYEISMAKEFQRFRGRTGTVNIGVAHKRPLFDRLNDKLRSGPGIPDGWSGTMKWLAEDDPNIIFKARWFPKEGYRSGKTAERAEDWRILEFMKCHLEMPPGQPKPPRGWPFIK